MISSRLPSADARPAARRDDDDPSMPAGRALRCGLAKGRFDLDLWQRSWSSGCVSNLRHKRFVKPLSYAVASAGADCGVRR